MDDRLKRQMEFALEIDKEKNVFRQTHLSGKGRNENDAEHAWHMAIMAYLLKEYVNGIYAPEEYSPLMRPVLYTCVGIAIAAICISFVLHAISIKIKRAAVE
nr:HD domain-containing protein [Butyrivibrio sp. AC2005]